MVSLQLIVKGRVSDCSGGVDAILLTLCLCHTSWVSCEYFFSSHCCLSSCHNSWVSFKGSFCILVCLSVCSKLPLIIITNPFFLEIQVHSVGKPNEVSWPTSQNMRNGEAGYFACFWFVCESTCPFFLLSVCLFCPNVDMHLHNVYLHCPWKPVCKQRGSHAITKIKK